MAQQSVSNAAPTLAEAGERQLQEPLLTSQQQEPSNAAASNSWAGCVRGAWMSTCGYFYDHATGIWTDGGERRPGMCLQAPQTSVVSVC